MAWYNASWPYRFKVQAQVVKVTEAIDNVVYDLSLAPAGFWTHVRSDGGDIRVTKADGTTEVAREVSGFSVGSTVGSLFFASTDLSTVANTDYYVYYGNAAATEPAAGSTYGKNAVWASYLCVFHLDEASGDVTCSKSNTSLTNTGVAMGATGQLRTGGTFGGSGDRLQDGDVFDITAAALTLEAWVNPSLATAAYNLISKTNGAGTEGYWFELDTGGGLRFVAVNSVNSTDGIITTALQHVAVAYDGANAHFYRNGVAQGSSALTDVPTNTAGSFSLGNYSDTNFHDFVGVLDEVRVSAAVRSANWMATQFNNQNSPATFWTTVAEELNVDPRTDGKIIIRGS